MIQLRWNLTMDRHSLIVHSEPCIWIKEREHQIYAFRKRNSHTFPLYLLLYAFFSIWGLNNSAAIWENLSRSKTRLVCGTQGLVHKQRMGNTNNILLGFLHSHCLPVWIFFLWKISFFARFLYFPFRIQQILSWGKKVVCVEWVWSIHNIQ